MKIWEIVAEHCKGKSISHPCSHGIFSDPTELIDGERVASDSEEKAEEFASDKLREMITETGTCHCQRRLEAGSDSWWDSVCIGIKEITGN